MINLKNKLQMIPLHPHKVLIKITMKKKVNQMIKTKGEMRMMGIMEKRHYIQECATMFKQIIPLTTYLVILKRGYQLDHVLKFFRTLLICFFF
jgi:hypothetical protein